MHQNSPFSEQKSEERKFWGNNFTKDKLLKLKMLAKMRTDRVKMHQNEFGGRLHPDPLGEITALPQTP